MDYVDAEDACFPSQATIAAIMQVSERQVRTLLAEMEEAGLIKRAARYDGGHRRSDSIMLIRDAVLLLPEIVIPEGSSAMNRGAARESNRKSDGGHTGSRGRSYRKPEAFHTGTLLPENNPGTTQVEPPTEPSRPDGRNGTRPTDDPIKATAHALTVLAFEQTQKPLVRDMPNAFPAVMGLIEAQLRAGKVVGHVRAAIEAGVEVWTTQGLNTSIAKAKPRSDPTFAALQRAAQRGSQ